MSDILAIVISVGKMKVIDNQTLAIRPPGGGAIVTLNFASPQDMSAAAMDVYQAAINAPPNKPALKLTAKTPSKKSSKAASESKTPARSAKSKSKSVKAATMVEPEDLCFAQKRTKKTAPDPIFFDHNSCDQRIVDMVDKEFNRRHAIFDVKAKDADDEEEASTKSETSVHDDEDSDDDEDGDDDELAAGVQRVALAPVHDSNWEDNGCISQDF